MVVSGYSRSYNFVPFLVVHQYFDAVEEDKNKMKLWLAAGGFGDVIALIGTTIFINNFNWDWKTTFYITLGLFLFFSLLMYVTTEEVDM